MTLLPASFYLQDDVLHIARALLGKVLFTRIGGRITGGIITETEAYRGPEDKASHAYNNRRTPRTKTMFQTGGIAYIYTCYGIHQLLNVVTNVKDIPHAVLIRALYPTHGLDAMSKRRNKKPLDPVLAKGPGSLTQALGITKEHNGIPLDDHPLWIEETSLAIPSHLIQATPRIGIDYAAEHALLPWRFHIPQLSEQLIQEITMWRNALAIPEQTG
jgi:DNA-3-methyladenine glycosylase